MTRPVTVGKAGPRLESRSPFRRHPVARRTGGSAQARSPLKSRADPGFVNRHQMFIIDGGRRSSPTARSRSTSW